MKHPMLPPFNYLYSIMASPQDISKKCPPGEGKATEHHRILAHLTRGNAHSQLPVVWIQETWGRSLYQSRLQFPLNPGSRLNPVPKLWLQPHTSLLSSYVCPRPDGKQTNKQTCIWRKFYSAAYYAECMSSAPKGMGLDIEQKTEHGHHHHTSSHSILLSTP